MNKKENQKICPICKKPIDLVLLLIHPACMKQVWENAQSWIVSNEKDCPECEEVKTNG